MHHIISVPNLTRNFNMLSFGIPIAIFLIKASNLLTMEDVMKKLAKMFEDIWVAVAFAEEGIYEAAVIADRQPLYKEAVRAHIA